VGKPEFMWFCIKTGVFLTLSFISLALEDLFLRQLNGYQVIQTNLVWMKFLYGTVYIMLNGQNQN